jgi:hypothetical protein
LRALTQAPMAVMELLPVADTTAREHTCALAALLAEIAMATATAAPNANFLIMNVLPRCFTVEGRKETLGTREILNLR